MWTSKETTDWIYDPVQYAWVNRENVEDWWPTRTVMENSTVGLAYMTVKSKLENSYSRL